jgi:aspartyl-tRNA(Asn)/glutamyl-tRNA(Gln) amidotransferase subunit A
VMRARPALDAESYGAATAQELASGVADGTLFPVELVELALSIAERAEPTVNAYASLLGERALRDASEREAEARAGRLRGPLHGVPIAIKDNAPYEGEPTGKGSLTSSNAPAASSAPMIARLLDAGAVVIGTTTTPEFGWKGTGISPRTGVTRNPVDPSRASGGSSAGSAVTVATGAVPIATGSDAGGSIRIPAAFCGVVGLKGTLGAIPVWPGTVNESLSHAGVITRSVADARAVLSLTRGPDARDPQSFFATPIAHDPTASLRVAVARAPFGIAPDPAVAAVFDDALARLDEAGIGRLVDVELPGPLPREVFEVLWVSGRGLGFAELIRTRSQEMDPGLVRLLAIAECYTLPDFVDALQARRAFNAAMFALLERHDVLLTPTMPITAFAADAEVPEGGDLSAPLPWITWTPYTYPFNVTGQPALTIPCGPAADGLPVGLQIVGPWAHDDRVLAFGEACERALGRASAIDPTPAAARS